jgi:predicted DNA-binding WGR domain protein
MAISKHVTEFAGYPVEEYDPVVGILLPVMPRRVFRPGDGKSDQFWAIALEGDHHTVQSGTVGTDRQTKTRKFPTREAAQANYRKLVAEKVAAGFVVALPAREFQLVEGKSAKFWAIEVKGSHYTVRFGRIGTAGQMQTKELASGAEARRACQKLIAEKTAKGYTEKAPVAGSLREALFSAMADNPEDKASRMALLDYLGEQGEQLPTIAYRVNGNGTIGPLESFLADPAVALVQALVIGFCFAEGGEGSDEVVEALVSARERLPHVRALFLGDITYRENEISWINQSDLTGLLRAFPELEHFRARGGGSLALHKFEHENLRSLAFEASNLPREVVQAVGASSLPALEHLELWLGTEEYGANTTVADLKGILAGKTLPALRYLGLRNSEITDDIACALAQAPILVRLRVLDLSLGTLSDRGAEALLAIPASRNAPVPAGGAARARTFHFQDDKSDKFWSIELKGKSFTVNFGKVGGKGQSQIKDFADPTQAQKEHDKLVREKVGKGYVETTPAAQALGLASLEKLDIHHHYVSPALVKRLEALGIQVDAGEPREAEEEDDDVYRYVAHSE